ncbi:hypothetical protein GCK72_001124 [Caenorhabditis remanei]|uniref:DUF38 domain-containing protein n=1 Tax=Caenorhabditis remanei TaxID=31234 RepID=A0A6A5HSJ4_CAERE|nr:hypothetical protein GCK72_001124 [Caenorhabditis remanei]KAF1769307.1 hypothetical protein GCK72_001124 [Caenorhabditis remanei]
MTKVKRFSIHEVKNDDGKISISIVCDEIGTYIYSTPGSDTVDIQRNGNSFTKTGEIHSISSELCEEFIENGLLECEIFELNNTTIPIPKSLQKIQCNQFLSFCLGDQKVKFWLELVDGPMEILNITEKELIEGMGEMDQLRNVEKQLMLLG